MAGGGGTHYWNFMVDCQIHSHCKLEFLSGQADKDFSDHMLNHLKYRYKIKINRVELYRK